MLKLGEHGGNRGTWKHGKGTGGNRGTGGDKRKQPLGVEIRGTGGGTANRAGNRGTDKRNQPLGVEISGTEGEQRNRGTPRVAQMGETGELGGNRGEQGNREQLEASTHKRNLHTQTRRCLYINVPQNVFMSHPLRTWKKKGTCIPHKHELEANAPYTHETRKHIRPWRNHKPENDCWILAARGNDDPDET